MNGHCDPRFARVGEEFDRNFAERGERGASLCVVVDGEPVLDLWGGAADEAGRAWAEDTVSVLWSATKGATALCAHVLAHRGQLDPDSPVARYWPEFARAGKDAITVADVLAHRSGVSALSTPVPACGFYDPQAMVAALAVQAPLFPPGTRHGYQASTFGWLVGEVVRRVTGRSVGTFLREEITGPLGADLQIGATPATAERTAAMILPEPDPTAPAGPFAAALADPDSAASLVMGNDGGYLAPGPDGFDSPRAHAAELPATGGLGNGRGLAMLYAPLALGGRHRGVSLVGAYDLARMATTVSAGLDDTLRIRTRFSLGYMRSMDNRRRPPGEQDTMILGPAAFGHAGFGGSLGFADPERRLSFGYTMNRMGPGVLLNARGQSLVDAVYRALGAGSSAAGVWV